MLFEYSIYMGSDPEELRRIRLRVGAIRRSADLNEALLGEFCCDFNIGVDGGDDTSYVISAPTQFHCITWALSHARENVRKQMSEAGARALYLEVDGEFRETPLDIIFSTNDEDWEVQDKIDYAEAHGYRVDWQSETVTELAWGVECYLDIFSDFGFIEIFDDSFAGEGPAQWNERRYQDFANMAEGVVLLRVLENDDHRIGIKLLESEPEENFDRFLHVVDVPFSTVGLFEVAAQPVTAPPGDYVLRWYVSESRDGEWEYQLRLWPGSRKDILVRKRQAA